MPRVPTGRPAGRPRGQVNGKRVLRSAIGAVQELHRIASRIGYAELGRRAGVDEATLRNWFSGRRAPRWDAFDAVIRALGCKIVIVKEEKEDEAA